MQVWYNVALVFANLGGNKAVRYVHDMVSLGKAMVIYTSDIYKIPRIFRGRVLKGQSNSQVVFSLGEHTYLQVLLYSSAISII